MNLKTDRPNRNVNEAEGACDNEWLLIDIRVDFSIQRCQNLTSQNLFVYSFRLT